MQAAGEQLRLTVLTQLRTLLMTALTNQEDVRLGVHTIVLQWEQSGNKKAQQRVTERR